MNKITFSSAATTSREIFFIDGALDRVDTLIAGLPVGVPYYIIDPAADGVTQIAGVLAAYGGLDAVHVLSHGASGALQLGNARVDSRALTAQAESWATIGAALDADGDLLLYACELASGTRGAAFVDQLAALTGANVAASSDLTGSAALGGNWTLDVAAGVVKTAPVRFAGYAGVLVAVSAGGATAALIEAGGVANGTAGTDASSITLTVTDAIYDEAYLFAHGWVTGDGGVTYTNVGTYGVATLDTGSGAVSYLLNNSASATEGLTEGQPAVDTFTVGVTNGPTSANTNVVFDITGTNDAAVLGSAAVALIETNAPLSTSGKLSISDVDSPASFVAQSNVVGNYGTFNLFRGGFWSYVANSAFDNLNVGDSVSDSFTVASVDGTTSTVQITINGTNDRAVLGSASVVLNETNAPRSAGGTLSISDVDSPATFFAQTDVAGTNGTFNLGTNGAWTYVANSAFDSLSVGQSVSDLFTVTSADGTNSSVKVTINGTNDAPTIGVPMAPDTTFNQVGSALTQFGAPDLPIASVATAVGIQADGQIVAAGYTLDPFAGFDFALARYDTAGALDPTFGNGGLVTTHFANGHAWANAMAVQADGQIVAAGVTVDLSGFPQADLALARYNSDGALDTGFGAGGIVTTAIGAGDDVATAMAVDSLGNIIVAGYTDNGADRDFAVVRYDSHGVLDTSFGKPDAVTANPTGIQTTDFSTVFVETSDFVTAMALQSDGKIVVAGYSESALAPDTADFALARYTADGQLDGTFNGTGMLTTDFGSGLESATAIAIQADGKIVVAGYMNNGSASGYDMVVARYTTDGQLDTSFNGSGMLTTDFAGGEDKANSIVIQADGKIVVSGASWHFDTGNEVAMVRLNADGSLDTSFAASGDGKLLMHAGVDSVAFGSALAADGSIVVAGGAVDSGNNLDFSVARITAMPELTLAAVDEDTATPTGATVGSIFGPFFQDVDASSTLAGIAIEGNSATAAQGAWQYSSDNGASWFGVGAVSASAALLLSSASLLRFVPKSNYNGAPGDLQVHVVDDSRPLIFSDGAARHAFNTTTDGPFSPVSAASISLGTAVTPVNDAPVGVNDTGGVTEAGGVDNGDPGVPVAAGNVLANDTDVDVGDTKTVIAVRTGATEGAGTAGSEVAGMFTLAGTYGSLELNADGSYAYTLDNNSAAVQALAAGSIVHDAFNYTLADSGGLADIATLDITINGTNDAAVLGSAAVVLNETNAPLSTSGTLSISDVDNPATFVPQSNVAGAHGTFNLFKGGFWTYVANSAFDSLNVGQSVSDTFTVASADGTTSSVQVTINGTNDRAVLGSASVVLNETNAPRSTGGTLSVSDVDSPATFVAQTDAAGAYGTFNIGSDGVWTYVANSAFDSLNVGQSVSDSFAVASADGTTSSVKITIKGTNDAAVLGSAAVALNETNAPQSTGGTLSISDVDSPASFVAQANVAGGYGTFNLFSGGAWTYVANSAFNGLNVGQSVSDTFTVASVDGTKSSVKVTINGTNDAAVLGNAAVILNETNAPLSTGGTLSISDVDSPATFVAQSNVVGAHGTFNVGSDGVWTYLANSAFNGLNVGQSVSDSFTVASADGTKSSVQVTIKGTNDAAVLGSAVVALNETNAPLSTSGTLSISDVDSPATFVPQTNVLGAHGTFNLFKGGAWTYVANSAFNSLNVGQSVSDTFTVASADGTTSSVKVTINGTNDAAILGKAAVFLNETNAPQSTGGTLSISDVDSPANFVAQTDVVGAHGTFNIGSNGVWTYVANSAFDSLNVGQNVSDSFTVASADGTTSSVKVTINGTNDAAILGKAAVVLNETNAALSTGGTLSISDVDSPATFVAQANVVAAHGTFNIGSDGAWTYVANSAFDSLNVGQSVGDSFTVSSADGTKSSVQVTINGTNDVPTVTATIADQATKAGHLYHFAVPASTFHDVDVGDTLTYTATRADGSALPSWLTFDATTHTFDGTPVLSDAGILAVKVTATDTANASVSDDFLLTVQTGKHVGPDFNGDGKSDLLWNITGTGQNAIWFMNGTSHTDSSAFDNGLAGWTIASGSGDYNNDGKSDILWSNASTGQNDIWLMSGTGTSHIDSGAFSFNGTAGWTIDSKSGDYNGDGKSDILWSNASTGQGAIWYMNGTSHTSSGAFSFSALPGWTIADGSGDYNGDGKSDILWTNVSTGQDAVWYMSGTGASHVGSGAFSFPGWTVADGSGDYNGDGKSDILWSNASTGKNALWLMNGTGSSHIGSGAFSFDNLSGWTIADGSGDYNGDGKSDLLWSNAGTGQKAIWLMDGTAHIGSSTFDGLSAWEVKDGSSDYNGDGMSDVALTNAGTGEEMVWLMNGTSVAESVTYQAGTGWNLV